jgi:hypothetical protein
MKNKIYKKEKIIIYKKENTVFYKFIFSILRLLLPVRLLLARNTPELRMRYLYSPSPTAHTNEKTYDTQTNTEIVANGREQGTAEV